MQTRHTTTHQCSLLARPGGQPVEEFLLVPFGQVQIDRALSGSDFVFQRHHAESAIRWFDHMGRKLAIDYEHQTFDRFNTRPDGLRPAAGWIGRLEIRDDGLWACGVAWTERAKELLRTGEYQYYSPVIYWTDKDYTNVAALGPVALTNDPAMRGASPLVAGRAEETANEDADVPSNPAESEDEEEHASQDENAEDVSIEAVASSRRASLLRIVESREPETEDDDTRVAVLRAEIDSLREEIEFLSRQLRAQEADAFVESGMRLGKILDADTMDWRADYQRDPAAAESRLARAPVLLPPGRFIARGSGGGAIPISMTKRAAAANSPRDIEPEDLDAYERALAAGRIRRFGA